LHDALPIYTRFFWGLLSAAWAGVPSAIATRAQIVPAISLRTLFICRVSSYDYWLTNTNAFLALHKTSVRLTLSDMKVLTMRELNRKTATVLDAVERGETFELRRNGRAVGYITHTPPIPQRKPDWKAHFDWLRKNATKNDIEALTEFEQERRRQA